MKRRCVDDNLWSSAQIMPNGEWTVASDFPFSRSCAGLYLPLSILSYLSYHSEKPVKTRWAGEKSKYKRLQWVLDLRNPTILVLQRLLSALSWTNRQRRTLLTLASIPFFRTNVTVQSPLSRHVLRFATFLAIFDNKVLASLFLTTSSSPTEFCFFSYFSTTHPAQEWSLQESIRIGRPLLGGCRCNHLW